MGNFQCLERLDSTCPAVSVDEGTSEVAVLKMLCFQAKLAPDLISASRHHRNNLPLQTQCWGCDTGTSHRPMSQEHNKLEIFTVKICSAVYLV